MTGMSDSARHVLHVAILRSELDLPLDGWEHYSTAMGDDGVSTFAYDRPDGRSVVVLITAEGARIDRDRSLITL